MSNKKTQSGKGLALPGLIIGLLTGLAVYGITEYWIDDNDSERLGITVLFFTVTASAAYLLLAESNRLAKPLIGAFVIAALLAGPDYFMAGAAGDNGENLSDFPPIFWFMLSRGLVAYLLATLFKASQDEGAPPPYERVFFHGLTMPLILGGAKVFAGLALVLLFAWARLLKEMDVNFFNKLFQEPWFIFPFLGAIGGLSIAMMRGQEAVLGALRYVLLLFCRIAMPITAVFTITFLVVLMVNGPAAIFDKPYPGGIMIGLAFAGMLIFNGVYQNGESESPPAWLRLSTLVSLIGFPIYTALAFWAFWMRIGDYGLTPPRIAGLVITFLAAAYSVVCIAGLLTELNWRGKRWMPLVGPLNTAMAALWVIVLIGLASPFANPWAISANSQYARIAENSTPASEFDYGYLRFELGTYGDEALMQMLSLTGHPEYAEIRDGVARARAAKHYWEYKNPNAAVPVTDEAPPPAIEAPPQAETHEAPTAESGAGPETLPVNPEEAPGDPSSSDDSNNLE